MPIKVTYQNPGLEYDENMVCEDFLNMGMLPLELSITYCGYRTYIISYHQKNIMYGCIYIMYVYVYIAYACIMSDVYTVCHIYIYVCVCMHTYRVYIYTHIVTQLS